MYSEKLTPSASYVAARGLRHHVWRWADPGAAQANTPPLVLVHGYMDVGRSFQFVVDALHERGERRHAVAPDLRGFGRTTSVQDAYWFHDYVGDLDALIDAVSPNAPVDLLGHSMGGNVVMMYAGVRPERVRRLINLEGFGLPETKPDEAPGRLSKWLDQLKTPSTLSAYASFADVALRLMRNNPRLAPEKAEYLARFWAAEQDGSVALLADAAHKRVNPVLYRVDEVLACHRRITAPLLWVEGSQGEFDAWWRGSYTKAEFDTRLDAVKDVQRARLEGAGHMLHHDQPEALAALIAAFLR